MHHPSSRRTAQRGRQRPGMPAARLALCALLYFCGQAHAEVFVVQPPAIVAGDAPLRLTLVFSHSDGAREPENFAVPASINVVISGGDAAPTTLTLQRQTPSPQNLRLGAGQLRKVLYTGTWPPTLRGPIRVQVAGFNAAPALVNLDRGKRQDETVAMNRADARQAPQAQAQTPLPGARPVTAGDNASDASVHEALAQPGAEGRLSFYEPFYIGVGHNGDTTSRFQLSFKYRLLQPADPRSRGLFDNLYFGYTQTSIWDLSAESKPFRDTSYKPSLFYYLPDVGWHPGWLDSLGLQAGIEHESNGKSGDTSRSINIAYVKPIAHLNMPASTQLLIAPKIYYYLQKSENADIAKYRGYTDLEIDYGRPDGLMLATTWRKGTAGWRGSVDAQLTYPLQKLIGGAFGGYVWLGYFNGYGEDLLDYNRRNAWNVRIGYSIYR